MPSAKILESKKVIIDGLADKFKTAQSIVLAEYRGITAGDDTAMRADFRKNGVEYLVAKNTYALLALKQIGVEGADEYLNGPTSIAFSSTDITAPAKLASQYAKKYDKFSYKAGIVEGKVVDAKGVDAIAELPPKEVLIAKVLGGFNAPISGFVNVLNGNLRGLAVVLNAIAEKKAEVQQ